MKLLVATPWFPTESNAYAGSFVVSWLRALGHPAQDTTILHIENVPPGSGGPAVRRTTPEGTVVHVRAEVGQLLPRPDMARVQLAALEEAEVPELQTADLIHAHVAMPTGWAVATVAPASTRFLLTEHASYVKKIHRSEEGREMYASVVARADTVMTVSEQSARTLRVLHPSARPRIVSLGNPVATEHFPLRPHLPHSLRHWLYVGNLLTTKGVDRVIRAFAIWRAEHDEEATLTLVGGGAHEDQLRDLAASLDLGEAVHFAGSVEHARLHEVFAEKDLLVHLSSFETFGLTPIEAALSGLPVVVTACGGPQETLADAAVDGLVKFVPVGDEVEPVLDAVRALENGLTTARPGQARDALVERYGMSAFGDRLRAVMEGRPVVAPPPEDGPVVVALALSARGAERVAPLLQRALRSGARTVLVTSVADEVRAADPRTRVVDLSTHAPFDPMRVLERTARTVTGAPVRVAQGALAVAARGASGQRAAKTKRITEAVSLLDRRRRGLHRAVHRRILIRFYYSWLDPWRFARSAMERDGAEISRDGVDVVVYGDESGLPLAWRLAQTHPEADVVGAVSGQRLAEVLQARAQGKVRTPDKLTAGAG